MTCLLAVASVLTISAQSVYDFKVKNDADCPRIVRDSRSAC